MTVADVEEAAPGPGEALVDVLAAGVCGTDLELARGYMGFRGVPGHEFVGVVRQVRSRADRPLVGARVAGEINIGCEECRLCVEGMARHCPRRSVLGILGKPGAHATSLSLPVANLRAVPAGISDLEAVFIEPLAAAFEIAEQVRVERGDRVLVLGDGRLGLLAAQALASRGARVTLAGRHEPKLETARALGLEACRLPETPTPDFDMVVEATGSAQGLSLALRFARPRGTVVMKSTCAGPTALEASQVVVNELTLVGSRCGRFEPAIEALAAGAVKVLPLVTAELPLESGPEAFQRAAAPGAFKIVLRPA